jgi:speckle-type POZ protein
MACSAATSTHTEVWRIKGVTPAYFTRPVATHKMDGPLFHAFGLTWYLSITPYITSPRAAMNFHINLLSPDAVSPSLAVTLSLGKLSRHAAPAIFRTVPREPVLPGWGFAEFVLHTELLAHSSEYFPGGVMTLTAVMTCDPLTAPYAIILPPSGLGSALGALLADRRGADVGLACADGKVLRAHALLLSARSPIFAAQLDPAGPWATAVGRRGAAGTSRAPVSVPPEVTSHTLQRLLEFIYTDELTPESPEEAQHLLNAADHYELPRLFAICEAALSDSLCVENAALTLTLADQHGATALKRATLSWMTNHVAEVMATDGWRHLSAAAPALVQELLLTMANGKPPGDAEGADGRRCRQRTR